MKIKVDIFMGMLGSGKTTFINSLLKGEQFINETIVIIQNETGQIEINKEIKNSKVIVIKKDIDKNLDNEYIKEIIKSYYPDRILIECNGMENVNNIIKTLENRYIRKLCAINTIATIVDGKKLNMFIINMGNIIKDQLVNSDFVILNNTINMNKKQIQNIKKNIKGMNAVSKIIESNSIKDSDTSYFKNDIATVQEIEKNSNNKGLFSLVVAILILILVYMMSIVIDRVDISVIDISLLRSFNTRFLGILIETTPFILLGAFVSALIQFFIPSDTLMRILPKNRVLACIMASTIGLFFPVCDCGTVPVARGFLKKGVSLSAVITFILAAPIVNPIAIMSTIYAFPDNKEIVVYRLVIGIAIAVIVGLVVGRKEPKDIFTDNLIGCDCDMCNGDYNKNIFSKIRGLFLHAGDEFFNIGKFMVFGAFLCSIMQTVLSQESIISLPSNALGGLAVMILFSFIFSVCSTSDAFIAKGFLGQLPMTSILGYLVLGPMIAIKNTMILLGSFKKRFVFKLLFVIITVSSVLLLCIGLFI